MDTDRVAVIGGGVAGLVAALLLAARGLDVTVFEKAESPGGKIRALGIGDAQIDSGPTVFTMRWVFDSLLAEVGAKLDDHLSLRRADVLARHAWDAGATLDLFGDLERTVDAIGRFAGPAEGERYRGFARRCQTIYQSLEAPFLKAARPSGPVDLARKVGLGGLPGLAAGTPFSTLWKELGRHFHDPRLRQLFGRYATYCGSSPFAAPALLMLIAHVEREGVWYVEGGMAAIPRALAALAERFGARFRYGVEVSEIQVRNGRAIGIVLPTGERIAAESVICNADAAALTAGLFGREAARALPRSKDAERSLSAVTWSMVARTDGFPLRRHNVFFSRDYRAEFADIFERGRLPNEPTIYVCAQDRGDSGDPVPQGLERLFCLVNAPARGDTSPLQPSEVTSCETRTFEALARCGLSIHRSSAMTTVTTPTDFARLYPGTGGALYGQASHGWQASFRRPGARTSLPGLYLAGGSTHPGPGVPMAALSGRIAVSSLLTDLASTSRSHRAGMSGGTSTPSATMVATGSP